MVFHKYVGAQSRAEQLSASASTALQLLASESATIGVHGWGSSLGLATCGAAVGAAAVAGAAGKLHCGGSKASTGDCPSGNWHAPQPQERATPEPQGWGVLATPFLMAIVSIPALLGSWCWPLLIAVAFGASGVSTSQSRAVTHSLTWGLHIGALGALSVYVASRTPGDRAGCGPVLRWAPFVLIVLGSLMMLLDLTRHLLLDQNVAPKLLHMYNDDHTLTFAGELGVVCTWLGVGLLVVGTAWFLNYQEKLQRMYYRVLGVKLPQERAEAEPNAVR